MENDTIIRKIEELIKWKKRLRGRPQRVCLDWVKRGLEKKGLEGQAVEDDNDGGIE